VIKAIIVEDEKPLRQLLQLLIEETDPEIDIIAQCDNIEDAAAAVRALHPQLIFLDVVLPGGTGFDLLERLAPLTCEVIFITAFDNFAVEAFRHAAIGYILKPVDKEELGRAISIARRRLDNGSGIKDVQLLLNRLQEHQKSSEGERIAIPTSDGFLFVTAEDILRCESDRVYTWIYMNDGKKLLSSYNLGEFRRILPERLFFQVHKSHIISLASVRSYDAREGTLELRDGSVVPVSRRIKPAFLNNFRLPHRGQDL
jgi:two-component system LytT family response regulator